MLKAGSLRFQCYTLTHPAWHIPIESFGDHSLFSIFHSQSTSFMGKVVMKVEATAPKCSQNTLEDQKEQVPTRCKQLLLLKRSVWMLLRWQFYTYIIFIFEFFFFYFTPDWLSLDLWTKAFAQLKRTLSGFPSDEQNI